MKDPICADCGHDLWLHAEIDYNGDQCCECPRFVAEEKDDA